MCSHLAVFYCFHSNKFKLDERKNETEQTKAAQFNKNSLQGLTKK